MRKLVLVSASTKESCLPKQYRTHQQPTGGGRLSRADRAGGCAHAPQLRHHCPQHRPQQQQHGREHPQRPWSGGPPFGVLQSSMERAQQVQPQLLCFKSGAGLLILQRGLTELRTCSQSVDVATPCPSAGISRLGCNAPAEGDMTLCKPCRTCHVRQDIWSVCHLYQCCH